MRHVIVIEDQILMRQCIADMVVFAGASSVEAVDSEAAAVEAARRHPPSVIISDVDLKGGGSGPQAVARIRELCGTVPAIFVTGQPDDPSAREMATAVLTKPCTAIQFARTFKTVTSQLPRWRESGSALGRRSSARDRGRTEGRRSA